MAIRGQPDAELSEALGEVVTVQKAAREAVRAGVPGAAILDAARASYRTSERREAIQFVAHGLGLVSHEAPRLLDHSPRHYSAAHRDRALEAGMVLSLETELLVPRIGLIKLEDSVAVTPDGCVPLGAPGAEWICVEA